MKRNELQARLTSRGLGFPKQELYLQGVTKIEDTPQFKLTVNALLSTICKIYYGVNPDNLHELFFDSCFNDICETFKDATIEDIQNAFKVAEIEKKQYISLSKGELLTPIRQFMFNKRILIYELNELLKIENRNKEEIRIREEFEERAHKAFSDSLVAGVWVGDPPEAYFIAMGLVKRHPELVTKESREFVLKGANEMKGEIVKKQDNSAAAFRGVVDKEERAKLAESLLMPKFDYLKAVVFINYLICNKLIS